jgi:U3 small nucleolar RNA-associated protein 23
MIIEVEKFGAKYFGVSRKLKSLQLNKCGHEKSPLSGAECVKRLTKENRYVVATQDRDLQDWIRNQVGIALLYLHNVVPNLEEPSVPSRKFINRKSTKSMKVSTFEGEQLTLMKKKEGILEEVKVKKFKIKKKGGPNPLSCKKKKIKTNPTPNGNLHKTSNKIIEKKNKARRKVKSSS